MRKIIRRLRRAMFGPSARDIGSAHVPQFALMLEPGPTIVVGALAYDRLLRSEFLDAFVDIAIRDGRPRFRYRGAWVEYSPEAYPLDAYIAGQGGEP